jgi:hypothetical protein
MMMAARSAPVRARMSSLTFLAGFDMDQTG